MLKACRPSQTHPVEETHTHTPHSTATVIRRHESPVKMASDRVRVCNSTVLGRYTARCNIVTQHDDPIIRDNPPYTTHHHLIERHHREQLGVSVHE